METQSSPKRSWLKTLAVALVGIAVLGVIGWGVWSLLNAKPGKAHKQPTVSLLPDKPPPPPPPPKDDKKPEPPKDDKKDVKMEQPRDQVPQPAQNEPLKMEGAAGDGESAFGSGTVSSDYKGGNIGTTGGAQQGMYAGRLQRHLQDQLSRNRKLKESDYRVTVRVWLRRDGSVEKAELAQSTGNSGLDELLQEALLQVGPMRDAPPENMQQPIKIRVTARGAP